ncbi:DUF4065 domain-containing protein [soil metagenome]
MISPITGKEMILKREQRSLDFRKENFQVMYHYYLCTESGEQFTTTELDELNMTQLYNQYREKHNLPFPDEIKAIREKYGLSATKMSEILGFGINSYRNYENGEVPSLANSRLIQIAKDPDKFKDLVALSAVLDEKQREKLIKKGNALIEEREHNYFTIELQDYLLGKNISDEYSGYRNPNLDKLTEMVVFFSAQLAPWKTKLNKLLFYADFLLFNKTGYSMSGARYRAINMGPVPNNFNSIFEYMANKDHIDIYITQFTKGGEGEQFKPHPNRKFNAELFNDTELSIINQVAEKFKNISTAEMIEYCHKEKAWLDNEKERRLISYRDYGFELSGI